MFAKIVIFFFILISNLSSFSQTKEDQEKMKSEFEEIFTSYKKLDKKILKDKSNENIYWIGGSLDKGSAFIKISNKEKKDCKSLYYDKRKKSIPFYDNIKKAISFEERDLFSLGIKTSLQSVETTDEIKSLDEFMDKLVIFKENLAKLQDLSSQEGILSSK